MAKSCPVCGKEFTPKNPKGRVCSDKCRKRLERIRKEIVQYEAEEKDKKEAAEQAKAIAKAVENAKIIKREERPMSKYDLERRMKKLGF